MSPDKGANCSVGSILDLLSKKEIADLFVEIANEDKNFKNILIKSIHEKLNSDDIRVEAR